MKVCIIPASTNDKGTMYINSAYAQLAMANGMSPVLIPGDQESSVEYGIEVMQKWDKDAMILLTGGVDVEPTEQGFANYGSQYCSPGRDLAESAYLKFALDNGMFVFGICRGLQLMSIRLLRKDIIWWQHINNHAQEIRRNIAYHDVEHSEFLDPLKKNDKLFVNSLHHQAIEPKMTTPVAGETMETENYHVLIDALATHYSNARRADVEIFEAIRFYNTKGKMLAGAVQWHPEELVEHKDILNLYINKWEETAE